MQIGIDIRREIRGVAVGVKRRLCSILRGVLLGAGGAQEDNVRRITVYLCLPDAVASICQDFPSVQRGENCWVVFFGLTPVRRVAEKA
jgi:hypothetical protein